MKGYKCDKCGKFFLDTANERSGDFKTIDENGNLTMHTYKTSIIDELDLCGDCTQELWVWLGKEILVPWGDIRAGHKRLKEMDPAWKPLK